MGTGAWSGRCAPRRGNGLLVSAKLGHRHSHRSLYKYMLGQKALRIARTNVFLACTLLTVAPPPPPAGYSYNAYGKPRSKCAVFWTDQGLWVTTVIRLTVLPSHYTTVS